MMTKTMNKLRWQFFFYSATFFYGFSSIRSDGNSFRLAIFTVNKIQYYETIHIPIDTMCFLFF